jgi:DNA-binding transcriptional ArsR family regulator
MDAAMANQKVRRPETTPGVSRAKPTRPQLASAAATFTLLSNPTRLHVLWLAAQEIHDVTTLAERTGVGVATMSQHLSKLRLAGLISARQEGRRHVYTVEDPHVLTLVQQIFAHIALTAALHPTRRDVDRASRSSSCNAAAPRRSSSSGGTKGCDRRGAVAGESGLRTQTDRLRRSLATCPVVFALY